MTSTQVGQADWLVGQPRKSAGAHKLTAESRKSTAHMLTSRPQQLRHMVTYAAGCLKPGRRGAGARRGQAWVPHAQAGVPATGGQRAALGQPLHAAHAALVRAQHQLRPREEVVPGAKAMPLKTRHRPLAKELCCKCQQQLARLRTRPSRPPT